MKRGRKSSEDLQEDLVKSTYLLNPVLKQNLAYVALADDKDQSDIVREAIIKYLSDRGLNPARPPVFNFDHQ